MIPHSLLCSNCKLGGAFRAVALSKIGLIYNIIDILAVESKTKVFILAEMGCLRISHVFLGVQLDFDNFSHLNTIPIAFMDYDMRRKIKSSV